MSQKVEESYADEKVTSKSVGGGRASASLWWRKTPELPNEKIGLIGAFEADDEEAALNVLHTCFEKLKQKGCTLAIGPVDGDTWHKYRWVVDEVDESSEEAPFFLEPTNSPAYPLYFELAGFEAKWHYLSAKTFDLSIVDVRIEGITEKMNAAGVTIRPLDLSDTEAELDRIYDVSLESFKNNVLYTPIEKEAFKAMYAQVMPYVKSELVWLAERDGASVGFAFAVPDYNALIRGEQIDTVVFKTIAILPEPELAGLGTMLAEQIRSEARQLGFTKLIYALIFEDNRSKSIPLRHGAKVIRKYTLYAKEL